MPTCRFLCLVLLAGLCNPTAANALDATFAGRWRVVAAVTAPWARGEPARTLSRTGIIFLDDRMLGRGPLTCDDARYETVLSAPDGLFQGALGADAVSAAATLGLQGDSTTLRVTCSTGSYDFHHRAGTDLVFGYDNIIYTLRRPEDPEIPREDEAFIAPVDASFACEAARSTAEQLICSDTRLAEADRNMAREFSRLRSELSRETAAALVAGQRGWLTFIRATCGAAGAMPAEQAARSEVVRCLTDETEFQTAFYTGLTVITLGDLRIEPRLDLAADAGRKILDIDVRPVVVGPARRAGRLRAFLDRQIPLRRERRTAPDLDGADFRQTFTRDYRAALADERLLSIVVTSHFETGVRVPDAVVAVNWHVRADRPLAVTDLFLAGVDWQTPVLEALEREAEPHFPESARQAAARELRDASRWIFTPEGARIRFSTLAMPLVAEPELEVPAAELTRFLRPDSPWRP